MTPQSNNRRETQQPSPKYNSDMQSSSSLTYPPGLRFVPTDAELIYYYLKPFSRDNNKSWPNLPIHHANIYESNPQQLSGIGIQKGNLTEWFFISERTKIKRNGTKQKRGDHNGGYWHAKALTKKIKAKEGIVSYKTTLNYYNGKQPNGVRTNWLMQEYRGLSLLIITIWYVDYAICKIYLRPSAKKNMNEEDVEDLEEDVVQPLHFWQATLGSHQTQPHDLEYHELQPLDQLPQFWPAPLDSCPPHCHDIQYPQPQLLDAIEYQYLYQSGPLTTYDEDVIESSTQDKSNGDIKKRKPEEEENETRKKKKEEEGVEALKEELKQPINSHQNSDDDDSFFYWLR
ncbi:hypothetical protein Bca52824_015959 [Brassica carinata]|uniref:NAC domain-containing protein n=1 Tax=Brassica carinata TaxID=52824 RepID=A0A8X7W2Y8_BRACI|nr:hypothetical protein Bca52824_015959 [Brassica carinata]